MTLANHFAAVFLKDHLQHTIMLQHNNTQNKLSYIAKLHEKNPNIDPITQINTIYGEDVAKYMTYFN